VISRKTPALHCSFVLRICPQTCRLSFERLPSCALSKPLFRKQFADNAGKLILCWCECDRPLTLSDGTRLGDLISHGNAPFVFDCQFFIWTNADLTNSNRKPSSPNAVNG
jgi:hypothetical protein